MWVCVRCAYASNVLKGRGAVNALPYREIK